MKALIKWEKRSLIGDCYLEYQTAFERRHTTESTVDYIIRRLSCGCTSLAYFMKALYRDDPDDVVAAVKRTKVKCKRLGLPNISSVRDYAAKITWYWMDGSEMPLTCTAAEVHEQNQKRIALARILKQDPSISNHQLRQRGYNTTMIAKIRKRMGVHGTKSAYLTPSDFANVPLPLTIWDAMRSNNKM